MDPNTVMYHAFLSYSHVDDRVAHWLHKRLETYRIPQQLQGLDSPVGPLPKRLFPIFMDREELAASTNLSEVIRQALSQSNALIVLCSPASARSLYVNQEISEFIENGKEGRIFYVIVNGEPNAVLHGFPADLECFPKVLRGICVRHHSR